MCGQEDRKSDKNLTSHLGKEQKSDTDVLNQAFRKDVENRILHFNTFIFGGRSKASPYHKGSNT